MQAGQEIKARVVNKKTEGESYSVVGKKIYSNEMFAPGYRYVRRDSHVSKRQESEKGMAMAEDGREEKKRKQGGLRTMPFILGE